MSVGDTANSLPSYKL